MRHQTWRLRRLLPDYVLTKRVAHQVSDLITVGVKRETPGVEQMEFVSFQFTLMGPRPMKSYSEPPS